MNSNKKSTVLIIDPDNKTALYLSDFLSSVGFNVLTASDYRTTQAMLLAGAPDVILIDPAIDEQGDQDILSIIVSKSSTQEVPVIILSSETDDPSKLYGLLSGANDYISKPIRQLEVLARINIQLRIAKNQNLLKKRNKELEERNFVGQQLAIRDELTGLYNKQFILDRIKSEVLHCVRYKKPLAIMMLDIDYLKQINEVYGLTAGDTVLKKVARIIKTTLRDVDVIARYGGDEFLIVMPNIGLNGASILSEKIRKNIHSMHLSLNGQVTSITASIGVRVNEISQSTMLDGDIQKLINEADIALYRAKSSGRNNIVIYNSMPDSYYGNMVMMSQFSQKHGYLDSDSNKNMWES